jgi:two-component system response regulator AtoC/two-component system nitrogen regulation response regulator NtrX
VIERAAVLSASKTIEESDLNLGEDARGDASGLANTEGLVFSEAKKLAVEQFERAFLLRALRRTGGNISRAAESVGMVRQSLQQKIRELELRSEDWSNES